MTAAAIEVLVRWHDQPVALVVGLGGSLGFGFLVLRRTHPLAMIWIVSAVGVLEALLLTLLVPTVLTNSDVAIIALLVATYSLGIHGSRRALVLGAPVPVLAILAVDLLQPRDHPLSSALPFAVFFVVVIPAIAGRLVRGRARMVERLRAQTAELKAHQKMWVEEELARERFRLSECFHELLLVEMRALAERVDAAVANQLVSVQDVSAVEDAARGLLAQTREAVVALDSTAAPKRMTPAVSAEKARHSRVERFQAEPWAALAAAGLGAGLLLELPTLSLHLVAPVAVLACVLLVLPMAFMWAAPLAMTLALWMLVAAFDAFVAPLDASLTAIALALVPPFAVAALTSTRPRAVAGLAICMLGELACFGLQGLTDAAVIVALAWSAGVVLQERRRLVDRLRRTAVLLAEQREIAASRATLEERGRLARELHDALGHSLTVVALQAEAARRLWDADHERALSVLRTLSAATHDGLTDLELGFAPAPSGPLLTAASLDGLVGAARLGSLQVETDFDEVASMLDDTRQVVVYRILQESLTNVLKHAPGATVRVAVRSVGPYVEVSVINTRGTVSRPNPESGRGLIGMRERAESCGGLLNWKARTDGGFQVRAHLPTTLVPT